MFETIIEAAKNFCLHQLGCEALIVEEKTPLQDSLLASIEITTETQECFNVYFIMEKEFVQHIATVFLEEEESDIETLEDMALECVNLVVGNAKVLASDAQNHFNIATPVLNPSLQEYTDAVSLQCNNTTFSIVVEKL